MKDKCIVCGANLDFSFGSNEMEGYWVTDARQETATVRVHHKCGYCHTSFEQVVQLPLDALKKRAESAGFDR